MDAPQISRCSSPKGCRDELRVFFQTPEGAVQPEIQSLALVVVQWGMEELLEDGEGRVLVCVRSALRCHLNKAVSLYFCGTDTEDTCAKVSGPQILR